MESESYLVLMQCSVQSACGIRAKIHVISHVTRPTIGVLVVRVTGSYL